MFADLLKVLWNLLCVNVALVGWGVVVWAVWRPGSRQRRVRASRPAAYWSAMVLAVAVGGVLLGQVSWG